jgi:phospholipid/cholesterol/gamma-HCH transport system substrate-binding protein
MERQARFVLMGSLVILFAAAVCAAVYWLHGIGTFGGISTYKIRFQGTASGIAVGGSVLFNGVRVGEVTNIVFNPSDPTEVIATIAVDRRTPVRADTKVGVDTPGLMGGGVVSLHGGTETAPPPSGVGGAPPVLVADPALVGGLSDTARQTMQHIDQILTANADPLHSTLSNLQVFSDALARNSGRVDGILAGLEHMTGGGAKTPGAFYELALPASFPKLKTFSGRLAVPEPTVAAMYDNQHILVRGADGGFTPLSDAQWSDNAPRVVQETLIQALQNAKMFASVGRPIETVSPDYQLMIDMRSFNVSTSPSPSVEIALAATILSADNKVIAERVFQQSAPIATVSIGDALPAANKAFVAIESDLIAWISGAL